MTGMLVAAGLLGLACSGGALVLSWGAQSQDRLAARIGMVRGAAGLDQPSQGRGGGGVVRWVSAIGLALARSGALSDKTVTDLEATLGAAGLRGGNGLGLFVGSKILLLVAAPVLAWVGLGSLGLSEAVHIAGTASAAVIGLLGPDYVVKHRRAAFLRKVSRGLPDALDMMVICSEAGLPLEPTIVRVAAEIGHAHPAVAEELRQTATELRMSSDRRVALQNLGTRTGLENLKRLGTTLVQTLQYGTPLSQALRNLSAEMRQEMLTGFEAKAAKLPVLLTVPMIVFILPTIFAVVGGPAMLKVIASLH